MPLVAVESSPNMFLYEICRETDEAAACFKAISSACSAVSMGNYSIEDHVISIEKFQSDSHQRLAWNIAQAIDAAEVHLSPRHCNIELIEEQDQYEDEKQCDQKVHVEDAELQDSGRDDDTSSATEDSGQENLESDQRSNLEFEGSKEEQSAPQFDDSGYAEMSLDFQFAKLMHRGKPVLFNFRDLSFISFYEK